MLNRATETEGKPRDIFVPRFKEVEVNIYFMNYLLLPGTGPGSTSYVSGRGGGTFTRFFPEILLIIISY